MICGKQIFPSRDAANFQMVGVNKDKRPGRSVNRLNTTYFCRDCNGWHVASRCKKFGTKNKSTQVHTSPKEEHPKIMKRERATLIIRNYSSKPI